MQTPFTTDAIHTLFLIVSLQPITKNSVESALDLVSSLNTYILNIYFVFCYINFSF